jgi:hemerythrin-like domain-containing protein
MVEHRLIMRMITLVDQEVKRVEKSNIVDQSFVDRTVDFLRSYADRTHHGKEENILFRDLAKKKLSDIDTRIMNELIQEHSAGRAITATLVAAAETCRNGDASGLPVIKECLRQFVDFYPRHIEKEDKMFFPSSMSYFTESEQKAMLDEFKNFDAKLIHDAYLGVVETLEKKRK